MNKFIKYYFWRENHKGIWQPEGSLHGYNSAEECKKDNSFSIIHCEENGYCWTILEAKSLI